MKKIKIIRIVAIILVGGILFFWLLIQNFFQLKLFEVETVLPKIAELVEREKENSLPPPLRAIEKEKPEVILTQQGVIEWTNVQREKYGFAPFKANSKLNAMAQAKVEDMFKYQYFSHYSPSGKGVGDLAKDFGYEFLAIGENLAMGNFASDKDLVEAWMASPGHRENILNPNYQEIGVAVGRGIFEGKTIWLAVQHFSLPLSACPQADLALKEKIDENQKQILELKGELLTLEAEIRPIRPKRILRREEDYLQKIEQYNTLVSQYNALIEENKTIISQYNSQVNLFNQCVAVFFGS